MNQGLDIHVRLARVGFELDLELSLPSQGVVGVYGPSGSGKTSLLRVLAGLERPSPGLVSWRGQCWQDASRGRFLPPYRRPVSLVFQQGGLFPHLSVARNLRYGMRRMAAAIRSEDFERIVALCDLGPLLARSTVNLSGGEQQRVALARALLTRPELLLLDEPLAAVDRERRADILAFLQRLQQDMDLPMIYVSHQLEELAQLADTLLLLERGQQRALGPTAELLSQLDSPLAHEPMAESLLSGIVVEYEANYGLCWLDVAGGRLALLAPAAEIGKRLRVRVHARDVSLCLQPPQATSILNVLPAVVAQIAPHGAGQVNLRLDVHGNSLLARITRKSCEQLGLRPGLALYAQIKAVALVDEIGAGATS